MLCFRVAAVDNGNERRQDMVGIPALNSILKAEASSQFVETLKHAIEKRHTRHQSEVCVVKSWPQRSRNRFYTVPSHANSRISLV